MIQEVDGDILRSRAAAIAHGVAANDPMNEGLAQVLHNNFPDMHRDFHRWCHQQHPKPGEAWVWSSPQGVKIINLITQEGGYGHGAHPGKAKIKHVNHALRSLKKIIKREALSSIAMPMLATGVGGLQRDDVMPIIHQQLADLKIPVIVYANYLPGVRAKESGV